MKYAKNPLLLTKETIAIPIEANTIVFQKFDFKVIKLLLLATTQNNKIKLPIMADPFGFVLIPGLRYKNNPSSNLASKL